MLAQANHEGGEIWIADSGSSCMTTPMKEGMSNYVKTDGIVGLTIANGTALPIEGYGSLPLLFHSEVFDFRLHLGKVAHVPMLDFNVFPLMVAADNG
ncbi:unnamed protein product, partial [Sphacelaria rigidula]